MANASYEPTLCCMRRLLAVFISSEIGLPLKISNSAGPDDG